MKAQADSWRHAAQGSTDNSGFQKALNKELSGPIGNLFQKSSEQNIKVREGMPPNAIEKKRSNRRASNIDMAALTQARAEYTGHDWYIWHTSEDGRVRESHRNMGGVLCRFSDPPEPETLIGQESIGKYGPGVATDCRCYAAPVIFWDEVEWPHRVYADGAIMEMTKEDFAKKFHAETLEYWKRT